MKQVPESIRLSRLSSSLKTEADAYTQLASAASMRGDDPTEMQNVAIQKYEQYVALQPKIFEAVFKEQGRNGY